jgi:monofunctional biosynthetic peptidoglycan transglycosylase
MRRLVRLFGVLAGAFVFWILAVWPPPSWYRTHWPAKTAFMAMRPARPFLYQPVPLDSIAPVMQDAVIIGEDNNFQRHGGIDYLALAQALGYPRQTFTWGDPRQRRELLAVLPKAWTRRDKLRGASTITQQLAKNLYLSPSRNPFRKLKEAVIAWRLEAALGKRRIMELYLNVVELGAGVWGVQAASRLYFDRAASAITDEQAAALAGALPFPLRSNPGHRPGRMRWRQDLILRRMHGEEVEVPRVQEEAGADSLPLPDDSLGVPGDLILPPVESLQTPADSLPFQPEPDSLFPAEEPPPTPADSVP